MTHTYREPIAMEALNEQPREVRREWATYWIVKACLRRLALIRRNA